MKVSRRDLFIGGAGVAAGLAFTPVPWKLLGDVSIWTQNWRWIPQPAHGPVETKQSVCTLCAAGCGMRVRMAGGWPVGIAGLPGDPRTKGALCPLGFAAHQLNWHPRRLRAGSWDAAKLAFEKACVEGPVVIVDGRPGRAASAVLEAFAAKHGGSYQVALGEESRALLPYAEWSGVAVSALGYDLENARTIVSFGAPLLDGWGTPGRFTGLWSKRAAGMAEPQLRLIQLEATLSRTAARARRWIAVREGGESALAAGLARVLIEERLVSAEAPVPQMPLAEAAAQSGLSVEAIRDLARTIAAERPAVVITGEANPAIAALNVVLGAVGTPGGIVVKNKVRPEKKAAEPSGAVRAMLLDSTVPWEFAVPSGVEVFRFAAWDGGGNESEWLLPAPGFLEELTDVPSAPTSAVETYAIAASLLTLGEGIKTAAQFLAQVDASLPDIETLIHTRCEDIWKAKLGTVYGEQVTPVAKFESAEKMEEQLRKGGVWMGEPPRANGLQCRLKEWPAVQTAQPYCTDWTCSWGQPVLPSLATKLYQESSLRQAPARRPA